MTPNGLMTPGLSVEMGDQEDFQGHQALSDEPPILSSTEAQDLIVTPGQRTLNPPRARPSLAYT